ncbi:hypothetical protein [Streptomyces sp. TP-A0874]|uniref:hypothetical protein n=1 Tax=Streptomyces sp. TP-A0874 TaxID=549819 RepID=UPI000852FD3D
MTDQSQNPYLRPEPDGPGRPGTPTGPLAPTATAPDAASAGSPAPPAPEPSPAPPNPLTAAQRARAEGRSPIIAPGLQPALLTVVLAGLVALAAPLPRPLAAVPVVLLQAVTAAGWYRLNGMWPARQGIALAFAGGVVADVGLLAVDRSHAPTVALGTLGVWCLLVLVLQLRNRSSADERLYALTAGVAAAAVTVLAAGHLAAAAESSDLVVAGAVAVAAAVLVRALPLPAPLSPVLALAVAAGAGLGVGRLLALNDLTGTVTGLTAGLCALIGLRVASYDYPSRFVHMTAGVALPLTMAGPIVYVLSRTIA